MISNTPFYLIPGIKAVSKHTKKSSAYRHLPYLSSKLCLSGLSWKFGGEPSGWSPQLLLLFESRHTSNSPFPILLARSGGSCATSVITRAPRLVTHTGVSLSYLPHEYSAGHPFSNPLSFLYTPMHTYRRHGASEHNSSENTRSKSACATQDGSPRG